MTKSIFDYENEAICLLDDILTKYSHCKLDILCKNKQMARIFGHFIGKGLEKFMESLPEQSQEAYLKGIKEL